VGCGPVPGTGGERPAPRQIFRGCDATG
jgi:hypothetical protein